MKLHWSPRSPFVRKVMIVLNETGQLAQVECVRSVVAAHLPPNPEVLADNPLGKIPTLVTEEGTALFDSRVICEYLDRKAGGGLFPEDLEARMAQLRWQALADGMTDILLAWRSELATGAGAVSPMTDGWRTKVRSAMARLDAEAEALVEAPFGIGHVAVACALGQLDFRWSDCGWRERFAALAALERKLAARPSFSATVVRNDQDETVDVTSGVLRFEP